MLAFLKRLFFYAVGIGLGVLLVMAFFGDRDFDYAYGAEARVKKLFRTKTVDSTSLVWDVLDLSADSAYYWAVVDGNVHFSDSEPRKEPCGEYRMTFTHQGVAFEMLLENCQDTVRVLELSEL